MMENTPVLETIDLYKDFGGQKVIKGLSLSLGRGKRHAIIGPNGAGKTTLFNLLSGLHKSSSGKMCGAS